MIRSILCLLAALLLLPGCISRVTHTTVNLFEQGERSLEVEDKTASTGVFTKASATALSAELTNNITHADATNGVTLVIRQNKDFSADTIASQGDAEAINALGNAIGSALGEALRRGSGNPLPAPTP